MNSLNTTIVNTVFNTGAVGSNYNSGTSPLHLQVPTSTVQIPKPLTYKFRVAEYVDGDKQIKKVGLQIQVYEHDYTGTAYMKSDWTDVERVQLPFVG